MRSTLSLSWPLLRRAALALLSFTVSFGFLLSCATPGAKYRYSRTETKRAIIFVPGYYGSSLRRPGGDRVWLTAKNALFNLNTVALDEVGLGIDGAEPLEEDGLLPSIPLLPGIYSVDAYGGAFTGLERAFPDATVIPFSYDWRRDLVDAARALGVLVKELKRDGKTSVSIVAHSMGGLVTSYYLRYGSQSPETAKETWEGAGEIDRVVFAGVPFGGTMHVFRNMHVGVKFGLNTSLLTGEAVASFPGSYELLPSLPNKVLDENLKVIEQPLQDPDWWLSQNWGLLAHPAPSREAEEARKRFTLTQLRHSRAFIDKIRAPLAKNPPILSARGLTVVGISRKTIDKAVWARAGVGGEKPGLVFTDEDFERRKIPHRLDDLMVDGDESVTRDSATLPEAYSSILNTSRELHTTANHSGMLKNREVIAEIAAFLAR